MVLGVYSGLLNTFQNDNAVLENVPVLIMESSIGGFQTPSSVYTKPIPFTFAIYCQCPGYNRMVWGEILRLLANAHIKMHE